MVPPIAGTEYILVSNRSVQRLLAQCALPVTAQSSIFSLLNLGRLRAARSRISRLPLSSPRGFMAVPVSAEGKTVTDGAHGMAR
jgi:hypothetical protein